MQKMRESSQGKCWAFTSMFRNDNDTMIMALVEQGRQIKRTESQLNRTLE